MAKDVISYEALRALAILSDKLRRWNKRWGRLDENGVVVDAQAAIAILEKTLNAQKKKEREAI